MVTPSYRLSNRQLKELYDRGAKIEIAIPLPDDWVDGSDPVVYARSVLELPGRYIVDARVAELPVRLGSKSGSGLASRLGHIVHADEDRSQLFVYRILAIICTIRTDQKVRATLRTQWPGSVTIGEWTFD